MKFVIAFILTLAHTLALAAPFTCMPKQLGGSGSSAILRSNSKGDFAAWYCPRDAMPSMIVCLKSTCSLAGSKRAIAAYVSRATTVGLNEAMAPYMKNPITDPELRTVWVPHAAEISALVNK